MGFPIASRWKENRWTRGSSVFNLPAVPQEFREVRGIVDPGFDVAAVCADVTRQLHGTEECVDEIASLVEQAGSDSDNDVTVALGAGMAVFHGVACSFMAIASFRGAARRQIATVELGL